MTTHALPVEHELDEAMTRTVRVDEIREWPTTIRCFKAGSCHLMADTLDELHAFARRLRLKRDWFQAHPIHPHYDLTIEKRELALSLGAVFVNAREQARKRLIEQGLLASGACVLNHIP